MSDNPFDEFEDEWRYYFDSKAGFRKDLRAFALLDEIVPGTSDIVSCAEHDEIYLSIEPEELFAKATKEQLRELVRLGVHYTEGEDSLTMNV